MTRVLLVGLLPDTVDFSDPALPPGMTAEKIQAGIDIAIQQMKDRGWEAETCLISPDETAAAEVTEKLRAASYDCVVIGGGIRLPANMLILFEALVNAIHKAAPGCAIAFNTSPQDSANAAARWVG